MASGSLTSGIGGAAGMGIGAAVGGPLGAMLGGSAGSLIGGLFGSSNDDQVKQLEQEAGEIYNKFGPVDLSNPIIYQQFKSAGLLSPTMVQAVDSSIANKQINVQVNPQDRAQEQASLAQMQQLGNTGLSSGDIAAARQLFNQSGANTQAKQNQILQQAQMRGQGGSGNTLAAMLLQNQAAGQQESDNAGQLAQQASSARRQALSNVASQQQAIQGQDYQQAMANNQNAMAQWQMLFNNSQSRNAANAQSQNQANLYNVQNNQNISNQNTAQGNQELLREENAKRQYWQDQLSQANSQANAYSGYANQLSGQDQRSAQAAQNVAGGIGQIGSSIYMGSMLGNTPNQAGQPQVPTNQQIDNASNSFQMPQIGQ